MRWLLPPVLWFATLLSIACLAFSHQQHWLFFSGDYSWLAWSGVLPVLIGLALLIIGSGKFRQVGTNINTFRNPDTLVDDGLFAYSRNPMYLGFTLSILGVAIISNCVVALVPTAIFFLACQYWYIPFEEKAAEAQFGAAYLDYKQRVRRWF